MRLRIGLLLALVLAACASVYGTGPFPLVGKFDDHNETLSGDVRIDYAAQLSYFVVRTTNSKLYCEGVGRITRDPLLSVNCEDRTGLVVLQCTGGRRLLADLRWKTCASAEGTGSDNSGGRFSLAFGMPQPEAQQYLATATAEVAGKPRYPSDQASQMPGGGSGTGFLISGDGLVVTNHHVIEGAKSIEVHQGNVIHAASVVAQDPANDLAILKTDVKGRPLGLASARASQRGDEVLTLGYPLSTFAGESQKATFGRINATTGLQDDARYLQIDIPIQPGNSGGPLLNRRGEVIGVVSASLDDAAIFRRTGAVPQNVNYAVKADYISVLLPPSVSAAAAPLPQDAELAALVGLVENSVFRIVAKP